VIRWDCIERASLKTGAVPSEMPRKEPGKPGDPWSPEAAIWIVGDPVSRPDVTAKDAFLRSGHGEMDRPAMCLRRYRMRIHGLLLGMMVVAGAIPVACGGETDTTFGPPDGLVGRAAPPPTTTATTTTTGTGTTPPAGDGGSPPPSTDGGTTPPAEGGTTGTCAVSWANDVFPMLESTGSGSCGSAACHANGAQQPPVLDGNAAGTYNAFKGYTLLNNVGYITPGDTSPAGSSMDCNLVTNSCGAGVMPMAPGALSAAQKTTIDVWIKCGAPQN
jgi:hypothetical protein